MAQEKKTTRDLARPRLAFPHDSNQNKNCLPNTESTANPSISYTSDSPTTTSSSSGGSLEPNSATTSSDSLYSTTSKKLRTRIKRQIQSSVSWRRRRKADTEAEPHPEISWPSTTPTIPSNHTNDEDLGAGDLDVLALSRAELNLLKRMDDVCRDSRAARETSQDRQEAKSRRLDVFVEKQFGCSTQHALPVLDSRFDLRLRGGGGDDEAPPQLFSGHRRRTTLPPPPTRTPRPDSERPNSALWWLAGGKRSRSGQVPTIGELRVRKEVEQANRQIVGFWGTVAGFRRVGKVGLLDGGGTGSGGEGDGIGEVGEGWGVASVKSASVRAESARSLGLEGDRAVGGDKPDGEAVAEAIGSVGGGSVKDQSAHGGSAKSVEKCEAAREESQGNGVEKAVDGHDVTEGPTLVGDNDQDDHSGEAKAKEAAETAENGHEKKSVDDQDIAEASNSVKSQKEVSDQDEHSGDAEAKEPASVVDGHDIAEESSSAKSQQEDKPQDERVGETEAKEASEAAGDDSGVKTVDGKDAAEESSSVKSVKPLKVDNNQDGHSDKTEAKEAAEATEKDEGKKAADSDDLTEESTSVKSLKSCS